MNIGIFTDTFEPQINGVVTSILSSIEYLSNNHNVYVFCPNVKPKIESTPNVWRFPSVVYPFQKEYRLVLPFNKKIKKINNLNLDIIHIHTPFTMGYIGQRIGKKNKIPMIHTYHTYFEKYVHYFPLLPEKWVYKYAKRESERFCNECTQIIVPSNEMNERLSAYNIKPPIHVIPSGIHPIKPTATEISNFKKKYTINSDPYCVFIGRIGYEKNIYFLIDAFELLLKKMPRLNLLIIGDGPEYTNLNEIIHQKELSKNIKLTGYLNKTDVFCALNVSKLMLFPSKTETQGLTVVESILTGTPVIGLNEMGVKNVIGNNAGGILTKETLTDYCDAALSLLENQRLYDEFSKKAIERGKEFTIEKSGKQLEDLFLQIKKMANN